MLQNIGAEFDIYTDGSCLLNINNAGGAAFAIVFDETIQYVGEKSLGFDLNNNICEQAAISFALQEILRFNLNLHKINIYSDSKSSVDYLIQNVSKKSCKSEYLKLISQTCKDFFPNINFEWIRSHNGNLYNNFVDTVARKAAISNLIGVRSKEWIKKNF